MSRPFRPRPLDIHKKLPIVKSVKDLDSDEVSAVSRTILHGHAVGNPNIELVPATKRRVREIPTPQFVVVESYERDYTRTFAQPSSYVRGRGSRIEAAEFVEYDLDDEDEDWLQQFNKERKILSPESFEWMLYKMEFLDHKARERAGLHTLLGVPISVLLQQEVAVEVLRSQTHRSAVLSAAYNYWRAKRERWQKPILRCLQPPPPVNDTNPFNVFRPREKIHRPHTRRMQRRENDVQSFEKLRQVRCNLEQVRALLQVLQKREEKKREWVDCEANLQRIQIIFKHDSQLDDAVVLGTNSAIVVPNPCKTVPLKKEDRHGTLIRKNFSVVLPDFVNGLVRFHPTCELTPFFNDGAAMDSADHSKCKGKRKRVQQPHGRPLKRISTLEALEPVLLFAKPVDSEKLAAARIAPPADPPQANGLPPPYRFQGRVGRGGRIIFDRWNPLSHRVIGCNKITPISGSSLSRSHPPPRLNLEQMGLVSNIATVDGTKDLTLNENLRTA